MKNVKNKNKRWLLGMKEVTLDILGSCISRIILLDGDYLKRGVCDERIKLEYYFDKNNIVSCMMPAPFSREEVNSIRADELYAKDRINSLRQGINKDTLNMIMKGKADYLLIDVHDLSLSVSCYGNTTFSNCAYEFYNTSLFKKYADKISELNFMEIPTFLWYSYIDLFFDKVLERVDSDHIILNRFRACKNYIDMDGYIREIPESFRKPFHANYEYNDKIKDVEEYIIKKVNPYVLDLTKFFITDERFWDNLNGVHYEKKFYEDGLKELNDIMFNKNSVRNHNRISMMTTAYILEQNMADDNEYVKYLKEIESPFVSYKILDDICKILTYKQVAKNRKLLAALYKIAYNFKNELCEENSTADAKVKFLIEKLSLEYIDNYKEFIDFMLNFYKEDRSKAVSYLEAIFLEMLNDGDVEWVDFLNKIEGYAPKDRRVLFYKLQYYQAVNDVEKIKEYEEKLQQCAVTI